MEKDYQFLDKAENEIKREEGGADESGAAYHNNYNKHNPQHTSHHISKGVTLTHPHKSSKVDSKYIKSDVRTTGG